MQLLLSGLLMASEAIYAAPPGMVPKADSVPDQPPGEWPVYGGTYDSRRYSPLREVTTANAHLLQVKWVYHVADSHELEMTPVVKDGVMYVAQYNRVDAIDARTGNVLWRYQRQPASTNPYRGTSIYNGKVFVATTDAHLVALDARNGAVVWDVPVDGGRRLSGLAPMAIKGRLIVGVLAEPDGYIQAYDTETGKHLWTWHAIPRIGEPGADSWSDVHKAAGAPIWMSGSYDPEQNVIIYGTGQPDPQYAGEVREGDNLYSDCIVAIDIDSGKLKWYFQTTPHDVHDWDAESGGMVLVDTAWEGRPRKLLFHADRNGYFYVIDRTTGEFLRGYPFIDDINWSSGLTAQGAPILIPGHSPTVEGNTVCPATAGATNWPSVTYSPGTKLFYLHAVEGCGVSFRASATPGAGTGYIESPDERRRWVSHIRALDPISGKRVWDVTEVRSNHYGPGLLSTAGGILFAPEQFGQVSVLDLRDGRRLWHLNTGDLITASPLTYLLDGKQYFAIASGTNIFTFGLPEQEAAP
jgi:alcohol dehydrogenase (cytochrome c)